MNLGGLTDALLEGDSGRRERSGLIARQHKTDSVRRISSMIFSRSAHHQRQLKISPGFPRVKFNDAGPTTPVERDNLLGPTVRRFNLVATMECITASVTKTTEKVSIPFRTLGQGKVLGRL